MQLHWLYVLKPHIVLISSQEADTLFFSAVARKLDYSFSQISDREALKAVLTAFPESIVIWSAEHPEVFNSKQSGPPQGIPEMLRKLISPRETRHTAVLRPATIMKK